MKVGRIEADGCSDGWLQGAAKGKMAAEADAECADFASAILTRPQVLDKYAGVFVVGGKGLGVFVDVALIRARLIVGEDSTGRLEFVVDLGHSHQVTVAGEESSKAADRAGKLKDFRIEDYAWITAGLFRAEDVRAHRTIGSGQVDGAFILKNHGLSLQAVCLGFSERELVILSPKLSKKRLERDNPNRESARSNQLKQEYHPILRIAQSFESLTIRR